jgi:sugar phosphate isomerase/epimerase
MAILKYNDGTKVPPRLQVGHSYWSLIKLPLNATLEGKSEWTHDEKYSRVKEAGFAHVEYWPGGDCDDVLTSLKKHDLDFVMGHRPYTPDQTKEAIDKAVALGAQFIFAQPADAYTPLKDVAKMVEVGIEYANSAGLAYFVEAHRGNFTENIPQSIALAEAVPQMRFTADLSHFVVVGEFYGWEDERAVDRMRPILEKTSHMHARIGNGEQVQVDVGDGSGATPQFFVMLWETAMCAWLQDAKDGDVFPFASELGPPRYAITLPDGREFSDRWEQSLVMKKLIEQAWSQANNTGK